MPAHLWISPAATGKTTGLVKQVCELTADLSTSVRVIVPGYAQVRHWRRLLAETGGVLGAHVFTFSNLYQQILDRAGQVYTRLSVPVQYRLVLSILDALPLEHYTPLRNKPGFIYALLGAIAELKAGRIWPESFALAVEHMGAAQRLVEIADVYIRYQQHMHANQWADDAGMGWLAAEALEADTHLCSDWPVLFVDGFDDLTPVQIDVLNPLADRIPQMTITLTGEIENTGRMVHRRYNRTRARLLDHLPGLQVASTQPLSTGERPPELAHLESTLLDSDAVYDAPCRCVDMVAAPNRETEVRVALRWLKHRLVVKEGKLGRCALLARNIDPYRHHIQQIAVEFGIPIHITHDTPLSENPCIAALCNVLSLPVEDYPRQKTLDAWFSPYFSWSKALQLDTQGYERRAHSRMLGAAAVWGKVIGGIGQWISALEELSAFDTNRVDSFENDVFINDALINDALTMHTPVGKQAHRLLTAFEKFVTFLQPPEGRHPPSAFVYWIENLIGGYTEEDAFEDVDMHMHSLDITDNVYAGPRELRERDMAALESLKELLRGFVWAEELIAQEAVDYPTFLSTLLSAIGHKAYHLPLPVDHDAMVVAEVVDVRGIPFDTVAILGLAEGEFPTTLQEDPLLTDNDRFTLFETHKLQLTPSTESFEAGYFYDAVTRPSQALLLTRPRLTDTGTEWQPSPYWQEVQRLLGQEGMDLVSDTLPDVYQLSSETEAIFYAARNPLLLDWVKRQKPVRWTALEHAAHIITVRSGQAGTEPDVFEGNLHAHCSTFLQRYGPEHPWSTSRLETYKTCPFMFFTAHVLGLEMREELEEGFDARQLGNIYHHIFESLYQAVENPGDVDELLAALPSVAALILDKAPRREHFRITGWWEYSRQEIIENVRHSLIELHNLDSAYTPYKFEQSFGLGPNPPLVVLGESDYFKVRGYIDRVDRAADGTLRIIDYKTAGPTDFTPTAVRQGKKLQLPFYALAAKDALALGVPGEGFYWHVRDAQPSTFTMAKMGVEKAIRASVAAAWDVIENVRNGIFTPKPPVNGCPRYCPATDMCWQYHSRLW